MPTAICSTCGHEQEWRAFKGVRLAGIPCEECGGKLRARTEEETRKAWAGFWARWRGERTK